MPQPFSPINVIGRIAQQGTYTLRECKFAHLPAHPKIGETANLSDANIGGFGGPVTSGSGTHHVEVRYNGTNWLVNSFAGVSASGNNTLLGTLAGAALTSGTNNTLIGYNAGSVQTTGANNTMVGVNAGATNISGFSLALFGYRAGENLNGGDSNAFFGTAAGTACVTSSFNSYFGSFSGTAELGQANAYYGYKSGWQSTGGDRDTLLGNSAGFTQTTGDDNTLVGYDSGHGLTTGSLNTIVGANSITSGAAAGVIILGQAVTNTIDNTAVIGNSSLAGVQFGGTSGSLITLGSGGLNVWAKGGASGSGYCASTSATTDASDAGFVEFGSSGTAASDKRAAGIHAFLKGSAATNVTGNLVFYTANVGTFSESFRLNELGTIVTQATSTTRAGLNLPHGTLPSSPINGDIWTTTAGLFIRINGVTKTVTLT